MDSAVQINVMSSNAGRAQNRDRGNRGRQRPPDRSRDRKDCTCDACGTFGHEVDECLFLPKVANCIAWLSKNEQKGKEMCGWYNLMHSKKGRAKIHRMFGGDTPMNDDSFDRLTSGMIHNLEEDMESLDNRISDVASRPTSVSSTESGCLFPLKLGIAMT